ncbi:MAG: hypothetical protein HYY29_01695 [Chloroflexi bacterium]|nr:hypothetical protein [Chloroflexota bacterium]
MSISSRLFRYAPMGMNFRNFLIRNINSPQSLALAKDKIKFKEVLEANSIPTPPVYHVIHDFTDMKLVKAFPDEFVLKPASSSGGKGIVLLHREGDYFVNPAGEIYPERKVKEHIREILDGDFSGTHHGDVAIIQKRVYCSGRLQFKMAAGLPDIRLICFENEPIMAMMRYATVKSKGRSNLAAGGLGISLDIGTGAVRHIISKKERKEYTIEELEIPPEFTMPKWDDMKQLARKASELSGLRLSGVDLVMDVDDNVLVMEINGRPGLEIQNVNELSLQTYLENPSIAAIREQAKMLMQRQ